MSGTMMKLKFNPEVDFCPACGALLPRFDPEVLRVLVLLKPSFGDGPSPALVQPAEIWFQIVPRFQSGGTG